MKKVLLAAAVMFTLTSCGNSDSKNEAAHDHDHAAHSHDDHDGHDHGNAAATATFTDVDPVCNMTRNEKWTEFKAVGSDTTWFCSPVCKEQFEADPAKFAKKS